jgi:hypothetical protein
VLLAWLLALFLFGFDAYLLLKIRNGWVIHRGEPLEVRRPYRLFLVGVAVGQLSLPVVALALLDVISRSTFLRAFIPVLFLGLSLMAAAARWGRNDPRVRELMESHSVRPRKAE